jgi:Leucine-rich repeat (LRR) protein
VKALNEIKGSLGWKVLFAWTGDDPCGDGDIAPWIGITCSPPKETEFRVVTELELIQGMIMGPFPLAVTKLLDLKKLDLHGNKLTGVLPPEISRLTQLITLNLRGNKLQDAIPVELGELKQLKGL